MYAIETMGPPRRRRQSKDYPKISLTVGECPVNKKRQYEARSMAEAHIKRLINRGLASKGEMNSYKCPYCHHWHVGHKR